MTDDAALDRSVLDELRTLDDSGEMVRELIDIFLGDVPKRLDAMDSHAADGNAEGVIGTAHSIKGSARNLGAMPLGDAALQVEAAAKDGTIDAGLIDALKAAFERTREALLAERER